MVRPGPSIEMLKLWVKHENEFKSFVGEPLSWTTEKLKEAIEAQNWADVEICYNIFEYLTAERIHPDDIRNEMSERPEYDIKLPEDWGK